MQLKGVEALVKQAEKWAWSKIKENLEYSVGDFTVKALFAEGMEITNDYIDLAAKTVVIEGGAKEIDTSFKKVLSTFEDKSGYDNDAFRLIMDQNTLNNFFHMLYHTDQKLSIREHFLGNAFIEQMLTTKIIGQAWKQMAEEYGERPKNVDAECGFGKSLFGELLDDMQPSHIKFGVNDTVTLRLAAGCAVTVEKEDGVWENFRAVYGEATGRLMVKVSHNDNRRNMDVKLSLLSVSVSKLKIFKGTEEQELEQSGLQMMANMGLNMMKPQIEQYLAVPPLDYPQMMPCTGLRAQRPRLEVKPGYLYAAADFDVSPSTMECPWFQLKSS